jgi:hypothetical protein
MGIHHYHTIHGYIYNTKTQDTDAYQETLNIKYRDTPADAELKDLQ